MPAVLRKLHVTMSVQILTRNLLKFLPWSTRLPRPVTCLTLRCHVHVQLQPSPSGVGMTKGEVMFFCGLWVMKQDQGSLPSLSKWNTTQSSAHSWAIYEPFQLSVSHLKLTHTAPCRRREGGPARRRPGGLSAVSSDVLAACWNAGHKHNFVSGRWAKHFSLAIVSKHHV